MALGIGSGRRGSCSRGISNGVVGVRDRVRTSGILQPRGFHGGWLALGIGIGGNRAIKGSKRVGWRYGLGF